MCNYQPLHNKLVQLPKDIVGKKSVLVLAGSKKTEQELQTWLSPLYKLSHPYSLVQLLPAFVTGNLIA